MKVVRWNVKENNKTRADEIENKYKPGSLSSKVLSAREIKNDDIDSLINSPQLENPFSLLDMEKAVSIINQTIEQGNKIAIYGDYDCDGICASVMLYEYLSSVGADVFVYIPERDGGYGVSKEGIDKVKQNGCDLIITVDNGITAHDEAEYIYSLGMKLIITDHHKPTSTLPTAEAIIDPHRPDCCSKFKDICGCAVAFKLIAALEGGQYDAIFEFDGDLLAIATIGDIMPLKGENKLIVKQGLDLIENTQNIGLRSLIDCANIKKINTNAVAFGICPRINAAGRLNNAYEAFYLLTCQNEDEAIEIAKKINDYNIKRQDIEKQMLQNIDQIIQRGSIGNQRILVLIGDDWDVGVIGIVAGKLASKYGKPVFVISRGEKESVGSIRSIKDYSIYNILESTSDILTKWGGHTLAGGLTVANDKLDMLKSKILDYGNINPPPTDDLDIDVLVSKEDITLQNAKDLEVLGPFGHDNKKPLFLIKDAILLNASPLSNGKYTKIYFKWQDSNQTALYFKIPFERFSLKPNTKTNIVVTLESSEYLGRVSSDLFVVELTPSNIDREQWVIDYDNYQKIFRDEKSSKDILREYTPIREDFKLVYTLLKSYSNGFYGDIKNLYEIIYTSGINFCKLLIILKVLKNNSLIEMKDGIIKLVESPKKVDLFEDPIFNKLKKRGM